MGVSESIRHHQEMAEVRAEAGARNDACYHLGVANGLVRWRRWMRRVGRRLSKKRVTLPWRGQSLYVLRRQAFGVSRFERIAGMGPDIVHCSVREGTAYRGDEALGPVVTLETQRQKGAENAVPQVAAANV
jgi:hypothetical protein